MTTGTTRGTYDQFVASKIIASDPSGFDYPEHAINRRLFPFQRAVVRWALRRGKAALFEDCGLGKSAQQLEWARIVHEHTTGNVLILCPLAVADQTRHEAEKFGISLDGITITNYERLHIQDAADFAGIVLDESSILKAYDGKTKDQIIAFAADIPYRLACTATPAPNDLTELCNHAEFLGVMGRKEIHALFFTQDGNSTTQWRLKGHARQAFYRWMASWCIAMRRPSDLGFSDDGFSLPPLEIRQHAVESGVSIIGQQSLFSVGPESLTLEQRRHARRSSLSARVQAAADIANGTTEPVVVWCDLNDESKALAAAITDAVEVTGSDSEATKIERMNGFTNGVYRCIVSKPSIAGWGMNWQHCRLVIFVGLSDSYEQFYQAVRRCWRFGQKGSVEAHIITSTADGVVVENINRKDAQAKDMMDQIITAMAGNVDINGSATRIEMPYREDTVKGERFTAMLGDSIKRLSEVSDNSIGLTVFSPPFPGMYTYTNSPHDIGNTTGMDQMMDHYRYLLPHLHRTLKPGRHCCVHLTQYAAHKGSDGFIGLRDFRGAVIRAHEEAGFRYYGEVCIDKNPQVKAIRTKDRGLLFKTLATDSSHMHMAMADYLLQFRKDGDCGEPIRAGVSEKYDNPHGWITAEEWIRWARPVWYCEDWAPDGDGIAETDVLNVRQARESDDERHLCPLQLGVVKRAVLLWSNPGDTVLSPFMGIGSEGYEALRLGRRFIGCELKESYWQTACRYLREVDVPAEAQASWLEAP